MVLRIQNRWVSWLHWTFFLKRVYFLRFTVERKWLLTTSIFAANTCQAITMGVRIWKDKPFMKWCVCSSRVVTFLLVSYQHFRMKCRQAAAAYLKRSTPIWRLLIRVWFTYSCLDGWVIVSTDKAFSIRKSNKPCYLLQIFKLTTNLWLNTS